MSRSSELLVTMRLLQLSDSALPVGAFSFSNTIESAVREGVVSDGSSLYGYLLSLVRVAATTDGVVALAAHRAHRRGDFSAIVEADNHLWHIKTGDEARQMSQRMGRKLTELAQRLSLGDKIFDRWAMQLSQRHCYGCYAVVQGLLFSALGVGQQALFSSLCYSTISLALSAALRVMRLSHFDTQRILFLLSEQIESLYTEAEPLQIDQTHSFAPQSEILASLHERGESRLFMN